MPDPIDYAALATQARGGGAVDYAALAERARGPRRPVVADGDTFADKIRNAASVLGHGALGAVKGAAHTALDLGELAGNAGLLPGQIPGMPNVAVDAGRAATAYDGTAERIGGGLETVAELAAPALEVGKLALAGGRALATRAAPLAAKAGPLAADLVTEALPFGRVARKVLGHLLDSVTTAAPANAGGRIVPASGPKLEQVLADALADLRKPSVAPSVELPPTPTLPPGYTPRATAPAPAPPIVAPPPAAPVSGRLVPAQTPSLSQSLTDALAETRQPAPPARVTLPPEPSLPPGYTPRTSAPKPKAAKIAAPIAAEPPKRAYFLKSEADLAAPARAAAPSPSGDIDPSALPAAWQKHIGQDLFPLTGDEGKAVADGLARELRNRGLSVGQAMMAVSKNPDIPVQFRQQILKSLSRVNMKGAQ